MTCGIVVRCAPCDMAMAPMRADVPRACGRAVDSTRVRGRSDAGGVLSREKVDLRFLGRAEPEPLFVARLRVMVLDGEVMREIGEGGGASRPKPRAAPPSKIQCPRCNHWKHPRASTCKQTGCDCECSKHQQGIKKKRQFAQITARDGLWDASVQRRLIHQVRLTCLPRARTGEPRRGSARNAPAINSTSHSSCQHLRTRSPHRAHPSTPLTLTLTLGQVRVGAHVQVQGGLRHMDRVRRPDRHGQDCRVGIRTVGHARTMR